MAEASAALIYGAMAAIMADIDAVAKDRRTTEGSAKFSYRGIDDVYNALHPPLSKHRVFMTSDILEKGRQERPARNGGVLAFTTLRMRFTFWSVDGSSVSTIVEGEGMDSGDKSSNKAMSVAHKYALLQAFCIPTADMADPDAEAPELAGPPRPEKAAAPAPAPAAAAGPARDWKAWGATVAKRLEEAGSHSALAAIDADTLEAFQLCEQEAPRIADRITELYRRHSARITEEQNRREGQ
ncbi:ERF family protein [Segnochrobactraceae bacterium EtOH-i3]